MRVVKCPKCNSDVRINIAKSVDENGEEFMCPKCGYVLRYAIK